MVTKLMLFKMDPRAKASFKRESLLILTNLTISTIMLAPLTTSRKNKVVFIMEKKGHIKKDYKFTRSASSKKPQQSNYNVQRKGIIWGHGDQNAY